MKLNFNLDSQYGKMNAAIEMSCEEMVKSIELTKDLLKFIQGQPILLGALAGAVNSANETISTTELNK